MGQLFYLGKIQLFLVALCWAILTASAIKCFKCKSDGILNISCASEYRAEDCGLDYNGRVYNACYSRNQTNDFPVIGLRYTEDKGCAFHGEECDFLRTILCHDTHGFLRSCFLTCCVGDYCNQGSLGFPHETTTEKRDSISTATKTTSEPTTTGEKRSRTTTIMITPTATSAAASCHYIASVVTIFLIILVLF